MKRFCVGAGLACFVPFVLAAASLGADRPGAPARDVFRAGAHAIDVSPPRLPVLINGGFLQGKADQVRDPLHARCLVLDDGGTRLAIVVVDSCMMPRDLLDRAKGLASEKTGIPADQMLIAATHTHSAPSAMGALGTAPDPSYVEFLPGRIAEGIARAAANLAPAQVGWAVVDDLEHTHCRRWIRRPDRMIADPFGGITARANMHPGYENPDVIGPAGPVDPGLSVLAVRSPDGRPIALLANYSMHYFGAQAVSADYYGRFAETVGQLIGAGGDGPPFVAMMSQGTSGDQQWMDYARPADNPGLVAYADAVARVAHEAYRKVEFRDWVPVGAVETTLTLRRRVPDEARLAWARPIVEAMGDRPPRDKAEVYAREAIELHEHPERELKLQAVRIGDLGIAAIPDEVYALSGLKIKARSPLATTFTIGLANGSEGYIPPPEQHKLGGYTTWPARTAGLEVRAEPKIVDTVLNLLEKLAGRPRSPDASEPSGPYARAVLGLDPMAYWRLGDMDGPSSVDETRHGHVATFGDGVALHLEGPQSPGFTGGRTINRAVHLAGGRLEARLESLGRSSGERLGKPYSVELWFWNGLPADARPITGYLVGLGPDDCLAIGGTRSAQGRLIFSGGESSASALVGKAVIAPKTWNHAVLVRDGSKVTVYLNGNPEPDLGGEAAVGRSSRTGTLTVGGRGDDPATFEGKIDEVAIYDFALTRAEVLEHYQASGQPEPGGVETLPGTRPLTWTDDIASRLVAGVDRFLLREIDRSAERRAKFWKRDTSSAERYNASIEPNRKRLAHILGVRDARVAFDAPELVDTTARPALVGRGEGFEAFAVRWPAFGDVHGEGLLLVPTGREKVADVVAIPDADQTPEQVAGLAEGVPPDSQFARRLAESGCRVLVPALIDRGASPNDGTKTKLTHREFLYRPAFELGRHLIGYEVQKVLAAVDWFTKDAGGDATVGVIGWGEGGLLALDAAALDPRIDAACVSGYVDDRRNVWREPIDRNVFGLLEQFGDAELAAMVAPRPLIVEAARGPEVVVPPGTGGGPGPSGHAEARGRPQGGRSRPRARRRASGPRRRSSWSSAATAPGRSARPEALRAFLAALSPGASWSRRGRRRRSGGRWTTRKTACDGRCTRSTATASGS